MSSSLRGITLPDHVVRLLLTGQKRQLRLPVVPTLLAHQTPIHTGPGVYQVQTAPREGATLRTYKCPIGVPGEQLFIREPFELVGGRPRYRSSPDAGAEFKPARQMLEEHSRVRIHIQEVDMVRLGGITEEDAEAEGVWAWMNLQSAQGTREQEKLKTEWIRKSQRVDNSSAPTYRGLYALMWDRSSNPAATSWAVDPWVWRLRFECQVSSA